MIFHAVQGAVFIAIQYGHPSRKRWIAPFTFSALPQPRGNSNPILQTGTNERSLLLLSAGDVSYGTVIPAPDKNGLNSSRLCMGGEDGTPKAG